MPARGLVWDTAARWAARGVVLEHVDPAVDRRLLARFCCGTTSTPRACR